MIFYCVLVSYYDISIIGLCEICFNGKNYVMSDSPSIFASVKQISKAN